MKTHVFSVAALLVSAAMLAGGTAQAAARVTIVNGNAAGVGFNDPALRSPVGGNAGTTLGQQRLIAFQQAADLWGATIDSPVEIFVLATFEPLTCTATSAVLGSAGTIFIFSNFGQVGLAPGPVAANLWHHSALADKRAGADLFPGQPDIRARFNSNLGNAGCLTGVPFYLGRSEERRVGKECRSRWSPYH